LNGATDYKLFEITDKQYLKSSHTI